MTSKTKRKPAPPPLAWSLLKIHDEQKRVIRRTNERLELEELMATVPWGPIEFNNKRFVFVIVILAISFGFSLATSWKKFTGPTENFFLEYNPDTTNW